MNPGQPPSDIAGLPAFTVRPIGVVRSPFTEKVEAPRQAAAARDVTGTIELYPAPGMEHAVCDLETVDHLWVLFWFHLVRDFRPKVLPPRSGSQRRGVLATRSPHRPNPIGLSVVRLDRVEGLTLHIRDLDILDGTPVLDVKPYVAYADSVPHARIGWLAPFMDEATGVEAAGAPPAPPVDPVPAYEVTFDPPAVEALELLRAHGIDLAPAIASVLSLGPQPHPYRRIKKTEGGFLLAVKDWRARFVAEARRIHVTAIETGYRPKQLAEGVPGVDEATFAAHRAVALLGRRTL